MKNNSQMSIGLMVLAFTLWSAGSGQTLAGTRRVESAQASGALPSFVSEVDNEFFPLRPGTTFYYAGQQDGIPTTDVFDVTHRTKVILGVTCVEVHDQAFENGVLSETTID